MSKTASLLFAVTSVLWMCATAFAISYNVWVALLFGVLMILNIAGGFVFKARMRRKRG